MTDPTTALREVLALSNKERDAEENREYGVANDLYDDLQDAAVNLVRDHGPALLSALEDMVMMYGHRGGADPTSDALLPADQQPEEVRNAMAAIAKSTGGAA